MRKISLILAAGAMWLSAGAHAQDMGGAGAPPDASTEDEGDHPKPPAPPKPLPRERFDKIVRAMFHDADANGDGIVSIEELNTVIQGRRSAVIKARFARIDADHNGSISIDEFLAWQQQMGSVASQDASGDLGGIVPDVLMPDGGKNPDDRALARLIEPLSAGVIAAANTNYDAGMSVEELIAYEGKRFDAADTDHDGWLTMQELRAAYSSGTRRGGGRGPAPDAPAAR